MVTEEAFLHDLFFFFKFSHLKSKPSLYLETASIYGTEIKLVGLSTETGDGVPIVSSAASLHEFPIKRAFFELIERASILASGPDSNSSSTWRLSLSNGVAAHTQRKSAFTSAVLELIERDRILRSWYGEIMPLALPKSSLQEWARKIGPDCDINAYLFQDDSDDPHFVVGVIGIPKSSSNLPCFSGFGCSTNLEVSLLRAHQEALQMMGFLWGEKPELTEHIPPSEPSFHQNFFLKKENHRRVRFWLAGEHSLYNPSKRKIKSISSHQDFQILDLSPEDADGRFFVLKATHPELIPLTFGYCEKYAPAGFPREMLIHPII